MGSRPPAARRPDAGPGMSPAAFDVRREAPVIRCAYCGTPPEP